MNNDKLENRIVKNIFHNYFIPTVISSVALSVISVTDMVIAGRMIGQNALAAISIVYPLTLLIMIFSAVFGIGTSIQVAKLLGRGELHRCSEHITAAACMTIIISLIVMFFGIVWTDDILYICGAVSSDLKEAAGEYLMPVLYGFIFMMLSPVLITFLRNDSRPGEAMRIVLSCGFINLALDIIFTGVCGWGLGGIASATVIAETLTTFGAAYYLFIKGRNFRLTGFKIRIKDIPEMIKPGLPVAMIFALQAVLTAFINHILMSCGREAGVAVYAVVKYLIGFIYALYDGVTNSMQQMLGIYYGEMEWDNIRYTAGITFKRIIMLAAVIWVFMELFAMPIGILFGISEDFLDIAVNAIRIQALFCISAAVIAWLNAFYRSIGREKISLILTVFNNCIFPVISILLLRSITDYSVYCVFWGLLAADCGTLLLWALIVLACNSKNKGAGILLLQEQKEDRDILYKKICWLDKEEYHKAQEMVGRIIDEVGEICDSNELPVKNSYYITLCVEELVANSIKLGKNESDVYLDLLLERFGDGGIMLRIRDNLTAFDPTGIHADNMTDAAGEDSFNLMGLELVKKIAREYEYKRTIGMNDFRVILDKPAGRGKKGV